MKHNLEISNIKKQSQHVSQLSFLLMATPKVEPTLPARRIGFETDRDANNSPE